MLIWNSNRIAQEHPGMSKIQCRCSLCGPVERETPLVRFDRVRLEEQPTQGYPRVGICCGCIVRARRAIDQKSAEAGMVRIGSPYDCSCCGKRSEPVMWFSLVATREQYICRSCLLDAHQALTAEQDVQILY